MPADNDDKDSPEERWETISGAARALGITRASVRGRITRGTLETRSQVVGNRRTLQVRLPYPLPERHPDPRLEAEMERLRLYVMRLEERLAAERELQANLREQVGWLRAELTRAKWRGVWPMIRRFWWGEG